MDFDGFEPFSILHYERFSRKGDKIFNQMNNVSKINEKP